MTTNCENKKTNAIKDFIQLQSQIEYPYANSIFYDQIEPLFRQYQNTVSAESTREYDTNLLSSHTSALNQFIHRELVTNAQFPTLYPYLYDRIQTTPVITPAEVQTVIDTSFLTLDIFTDYITPYNPVLPTLFNDYYSPGSFGGSGMNSFCALVPNMFAAYTDLMNTFQDIKSYANKFTNILSAIQEFSVAGMLEHLKKQALQVIDEIVEKVRSKIRQVTGLFAKISNFKINHNNIFSKMHDEKQKVDQVISEPSIDNLKKAVEGAIAFASSLFEELKLEEIQFIILRFCELISGIENFFDNLTKPLTDIPNNYRSSFEFLRSSGYGGTSRAIAAGAFRIPSSQRSSSSKIIESMPATVVGGSGVAFNDEGFAINGGVAVRRRSYRISPITEEELSILNNELTFERVSKGGSDNIQLILGQSFSIDGPKVWTNVRPVEKIMLYRLSKRLGKKMVVNSAYRSSFAQSSINGQASRSWHSSGQAFDVRMSSYSGISFEEFKGHANSIGFSRVRPYNGSGFVHIDTGPPSQMW